MNSGLPEQTIRNHFGDYDAFIRKPFSVDELLPVMHRLLSQD